MEKVKRTPAKLNALVEPFGLEIINKGVDFDTREITIPDENRTGKEARQNAAAYLAADGGCDQPCDRLSQPRTGAADRTSRRADEYLRSGRADSG